MILLLALALAQDAPAANGPDAPPFVDEPAPEAEAEPTPEPEPAPEPIPAEAEEEIVVYGELAVAKARDALVREMERLGWRAKEKGDGTLKFKAPSGWMGSARFDPELASLDFRRNAIGFRLADYQEPEHTLPPGPTDPAGVAHDAPVSSGAGMWLFPRKKKVDGVWTQVRDTTRDELDAYQKVKYATVFEERLQGIAARLDALYDAGIPLEGDPRPIPEAERLQAIVDFWATRADTREGLRMTKAVEAWLVNRVDAVPDEMRSKAEARREDARPFPTLGH